MAEGAMCKALIMMGMLFGVVASVEATDSELISDATARVKEYCPNGRFEGVDQEQVQRGKAALDYATGGRNYIREAAVNAKDQEDFQKKMAAEAKDRVVGQVWPIFAGVTMFVLLLYSICSWSCDFCRPCDNGRSNGLIMKNCSVFVCIFLVLVAGLYTSVRGVYSSTQGFDSFNCVTASLMSQGLGGNMSKNFIGFSNGVSKMSLLIENLQDNSDFMREIDEFREDTRVLSTHSVSADASVKAAVDGGCECGTDLETFHKNSKSLYYMKIRTTLLMTFGDENRENLRTIFEGARNATDMMKGMLSSVVGPMVSHDHALEPFKWLAGIVVCIFLGGIAVLSFGFTGKMMMLVHGEGMDNATYDSPHRLTCCSWYWATWFAIFCFIFGGILLGLCTTLACLCEMLDDLDGNMLKDIGRSFNVQSYTDIDLVTLVDNCLNPKDASGDFSLLNLRLKSTDSIDMHTALMRELITPIRAVSTPPTEFAEIPNISLAPTDCDSLCTDAEDLSAQLQTSANNVQVNVDNIISKVSKEVIEPSEEVMNKLGCSWMVPIWQGMIDSVCYQGIHGVRRIAQGHLISAFPYSLLAILTYLMWRVMVDNLTYWEDLADEAYYAHQHAQKPTRSMTSE